MFIFAKSPEQAPATFAVPSNYPQPANPAESALLNRTLKVLGQWKALVEADCQALTSADVKPHRTFLAHIMSDKKETLVSDLWKGAFIVSDAFKARYEKFFGKAVQELKGFVDKNLEAAPKEVRAKYKEFVSVAKIWREFGFPESVLENFPSCALFLKKTNLLYHIRAYQMGSQDPELKKGIQLDRDGHPMIFMQGAWTRWENIETKLTYDSYEKEIVSKDNPKQVWNYFPANPQDARFSGGLVPVDRYNEIFPIHTLTPEERQRLSELGMKFYETNPERDAGTPKTCFLQVFTTEREAIYPENPLFDNLNKEMFTHVGVRLVDAEGKVYSLGFEMNQESQRSITGDKFPFTYLATADCQLTSSDYEELRKFDQRRVTTIPLTEERFKKMLASAKELTQSNMRFNYIKQNCTSFGAEMVKQAGYEEDFLTNLSSSIWRAMPSPKDIPGIGPVLDKIHQVVSSVFTFVANWTPSFVKTGFNWAVTVVFFIPDRISIILRNLIFIRFGAMQHTPVRPNVPESKTSGIKTFTSLMPHWTDIFKNEPGIFYSPGRFKAWQNAQKSTALLDYEGPKFHILPKAPVTATSA